MSISCPASEFVLSVLIWLWNPSGCLLAGKGFLKQKPGWAFFCSQCCCEKRLINELSFFRYGGVGLADVAALLDEHIGAGRIVEHLWRGEMAPPQGHPRPELAHFPGDSSPPQLPSSAGVGALKETEVLTGGEGQQRAASPGGSDGEVDESVLGYSMTASDSSEEGLFSPSGGTDAAGKQGGRSVGASFGSGLFSLESTGGAALMELARSEGASKGGDITSGCGVHNTINSPDVHNECESGVTGMMLRGEGQQEGMLLRRGTKLEVEKRMHATALQGSLSSAKESTWFSFYFSEGVRFDAKVYFGVSVAAIAAIVGFQLVRQH